MSPAVFSCLVAVQMTFGTADGKDAEIIESGKSISLTVTGVPESDRAAINGTYPISKEGALVLPFVGKVAAGGLTAKGLESKLDAVYLEKQVFQRAAFQVMATPGCITEASVAVGGQVKKPGPVPMTRGLTIYQAIQAAGGVDYFGEVKRVKLFRNGEMRIYDLSEEKWRMVPLEKNDMIEVTVKRFSGAG
jgi:protein involved in polysaccharide export with SLBB domain